MRERDDHEEFTKIYSMKGQIMATLGDKVLAKDDKFIRNEKSWRRARIGVVIFAVIWLFIVYAVFRSAPYWELNKEDVFFSIGWLFFWMVLIDWLNIRIYHIQAIKYYRNIIKDGLGGTPLAEDEGTPITPVG